MSRKVSELWKIPTPPDHNISEEFSDNKLTSALNLLKPGKAPGPDYICSEFILYGGKALKSWLREFLSSCLHHLKIPKIWRRADVIATPKPNKPLDVARSHHPISLLCVPYTILERLLHSRVEPMIDPHLPSEQAGFRRDRSTLEQVTRISQDIEDCFEDKKKAGAVFIDLTTAYDTVWHPGLACKLLRLLPDKHMVKMMMELIYNRSFTLNNGKEKKSRLRRLKNGAPQGSVLAPLLFNIYINDLPPATSKLYAYADDLAIVHSAAEWSSLEKKIHKMGMPLDSPASFRPISLTSCVSKLFERIILSRLLFFLESNSILSPPPGRFPP